MKGKLLIVRVQVISKQLHFHMFKNISLNYPLTNMCPYNTF